MPVKIQRSPRYPTISLPEAIEKAREVYRSDFRNKIPKTLVAEHMGYGGLNGASLGVISAVSKYGLLDGGRDAMWITPRAVDIFEREPGDPERLAAIRAAAAEPELFREIDEAFPEKASDSAIRSFLITKRGFLPDSAVKLIKSYRDTCEYLDANGGGIAASVAAEAPGPGPGPGPAEHTPPTPAQPPSHARQTPSGPSAPAMESQVRASPPTVPGTQQAAFPLAEGTVYLTFPEHLTSDGYAELSEYLTIFLRRAERMKRLQETRLDFQDDLEG